MNSYLTLEMITFHTLLTPNQTQPDMILGPTPTTLRSSPASSRFKATALRLFVAGKGGQARNATARRPRKRASKKKGVRNRERIQFQPHLPRPALFSCSIPFHFHLVIAGCFACLLGSSTCPVLAQRRRQKQEKGIPAGRWMSDRELRPLRSISMSTPYFRWLHLGLMILLFLSSIESK
jgi:hypothetical protein